MISSSKKTFDFLLNNIIIFFSLQYCKYYMVKFCPHDLFVNTRADLGVCPKVHDDEVKDLFERAESSYKKAQYVEEFLRFCRHMISDVESKTHFMNIEVNSCIVLNIT